MVGLVVGVCANPFISPVVSTVAAIRMARNDSSHVPLKRVVVYGLLSFVFVTIVTLGSQYIAMGNGHVGCCIGKDVTFYQWLGLRFNPWYGHLNTVVPAVLALLSAVAGVLLSMLMWSQKRKREAKLVFYAYMWVWFAVTVAPHVARAMYEYVGRWDGWSYFFAWYEMYGWAAGY